DAQHEVHAGFIGFEDGACIEAVHAGHEATLLQICHNPSHSLEPALGGAAKIDNISPAATVVLRHRQDILTGHAMGVHFPSQDFHLILAVTFPHGLVAEERGDVLQIAGAADHRHTHSFPDERKVTAT